VLALLLAALGTVSLRRAHAAETPATAEPATLQPPAAQADTEAPSKPRAAESPRGPDERRRVPDYTGRSAGTSVGEGLLWVPRIVLFPLYLATEYLVRRPLGWLVSTTERERWATVSIDFFTWDNRQAGIVPTIAIDLHLRTTAGVYAFWNDVFVPSNDVRLRAAFGGSDLYQLRFVDRFPLGRGTLSLLGAYESRPDNEFRGIGTNADEPEARYFQSTARTGALYRVPWIRSSYLRLGAEVRQVQLDGSRQCCDDPSLDDRVAAGVYFAPAGMDQVYEVSDQAAQLVLDSRWPRAPEGLPEASDSVTPPGTGVRLALRGDLSEVLGRSLGRAVALADGWVHYGASLGGYVDLTGEQRSVGLTAIVDFVDPFNASGGVPLTDLISLGGERPLQGFLANRFVDRSAAALRLEYRWPVAVWLDGQLSYEAGNVFGAGLTGLDLRRFRSSFGIGMASAGNQDHRFQALIALGTSSYESGAHVDSLRFVLGTSAGF
jgi:hypothetical protein